MSKKIKGKGQEMLYLVAYPFFYGILLAKASGAEILQEAKIGATISSYGGL